MLAIETVFDVIWLPLIIVFAAFIGFTLRNQQIKKYKKRILSLENEMLNNHAEILRLQQELVLLEKSRPATKSLVVNMKETLPDEKEENPDAASRKKANP